MDTWSPSPSTGPLQELREAATLWAGEFSGPDGIIRAAAESVGAGLGGAGLAELAGEPYGSRNSIFPDLVRTALDEVSVHIWDPGTEQARLAALRLLCRQILESDRPARDVSPLGTSGARA